MYNNKEENTMKRRLGIVIMVLALAFVGTAGYAMPLTAGEGTVTLTCTTLDGETYELVTSELNLMGRDEGGYLIAAEGQVLRISSGNLQSLVDSIGSNGLTSLPTLNSYTTISRGAKGDDVVKLQEKLIQSKYLNGSADGDFGGMTQRALTALQKDYGLEQTGEADAYTQMLLDSIVQDPIAISSKLVKGGRFENITSHANVDLSNAVERNLILDYDDLAGTGMITNGNQVTYSTNAAADIDKCDFTFQFGLNVQENNDGSFTVEPAMNIASVAVRRPIVQEVTLKSGTQRYTFAVSNVKSELQGIKSKESATVLLNKEVASMLAQCAEAGELKLRVICRYNTYDIDVPTSALSEIADIGYAAQGL